MTSDPPNDRPRLFPDGVDQIQLHHHDDQLAFAIDRCRRAGWDIIELSSERWSDSDSLHDDLSRALAFPSYYGRNLDALHDMMMELGRTGRGFTPTATGGLLVVRHFDQFVVGSRSRAEMVADILASATNRALHYGWPLAVFLVSDDLELRLPPVAAINVEWSRGPRP